MNRLVPCLLLALGLHLPGSAPAFPGRPRLSAASLPPAPGLTIRIPGFSPDAGRVLRPVGNPLAWSHLSRMVFGSMVGAPFSNEFTSQRFAAVSLEATPASGNPVVVSITLLGDGRVQLQFTSTPGNSYRVEYRDSLADPLWLPLGPDILATGPVTTVVDSTTPSPTRFYRVGVRLTSVYSVNIVGHVTLQIAPGCTLLANPLFAVDNTIAALIPDAPDGTAVFTDSAVNEYFFDFGWADPSMPLLPGQPLILCNPSPSPFLLNFVGEVLQAPVIYLHPTNTTASAGATATFCVEALSSEGLNYEWRFNNTPIAEASTRCLTLTNVQPSNVGGYSVRISNAFGAVTSLVATLTLENPVIVSVALIASGRVELQFTSIPGRYYQVEYTDSLEPFNWTLLDPETPILATGLLTTVIDSTAPAFARFYRVVGVPP